MSPLPAAPRPATVDDAAEFIRLKADIMRHHYPIEIDFGAEPGWPARAQAAFRAMLAHPDYGKFVVDDPARPGTLIGAISARLDRSLPGPGRTGVQCYLSDMCVDERARGTGVGRALFDAVAAWARAQGADNLWLHATPGAEAVYRSLGFEPREYPEKFRTMQQRLG